MQYLNTEKKVCALLQPGFPNNQKIEQPVTTEMADVEETKSALFKEKPTEGNNEQK